MIIAIDGTSGSGKSTTAKRLAKELNFLHIDSGSLYRVATYFCIINDIKSDDDNPMFVMVIATSAVSSNTHLSSSNIFLSLLNLMIYQ